jgi:hypothetical protein
MVRPAISVDYNGMGALIVATEHNERAGTGSPRLARCDLLLACHGSILPRFLPSSNRPNHRREKEENGAARMIVKTCTRCGETKPAREFFGSAPSGNLKGSCRLCMNKAAGERDRRNKEGRQVPDLKRAQARNGTRRSFPSEIKQQLWKRQDGLCLCGFEQIEHLTQDCGLHRDRCW